MFTTGIYTDFVHLPEIAALGYDYVEISLRALAELTEAEFNEFVAYVEGRDIRVRACRDMLPASLPITGAGVNATALHGYLNHALRRAQRLGVRVAVLDAAACRNVPGEDDFTFAWRQLGNFLRLAQGHARDCGVTVAVEPLRKQECPLLNLVSEATLIAGLLQLDRIAVSAHTGHMAMALEPVSTLRRCGPLLGHVHVENALTRALPRPGDGEDYGRLIRLLEDIGYSGGVTLLGEIADSFARDARLALQTFTALLKAR